MTPEAMRTPKIPAMERSVNMMNLVVSSSFGAPWGNSCSLLFCIKKDDGKDA